MDRVAFLVGSIDKDNPVFFCAPGPAGKVAAEGRMNVLMVYEDRATRARAMQVYSELLRKLGGRIAFQHQTWKSSVLRNRKMRQLAVHDAVTADLIVISLHGDSQCPPELQKWIHGWSLLKTTKTAGRLLVVLRDHCEAANTQPRDYWRTVARDSGMDLFCAALPRDEDEEEGSPFPDPSNDLSLAC